MAIAYLSSEKGAELPEWKKFGSATFLEELLQTDTSDSEAMSAGFFKQIDGEAFEFKYPFDEFNFIYELVGELLVTDEVKTYNVKVGDVISINKGSSMKFEVKGGYAKIFYVAKKPIGP